MKISQKLLHYLLWGILVVFFAAGIIWLTAGRISLFETSTYTSRFALDTALERYQANVLWLNLDTDVKQTFIAEYPGLYQVSVFFENTQDWPQDVAVAFLLKKHCNSPQNIRQVVVAAADIEDNNFYPFKFLPVDDSAGQSYCFVVESFQDVGEQRIGVWASGYDVYDGGKAFYQPPPIAEDKQAVISKQATAEQPANFAYKVFLPLVQAGQSKNLPLAFDTGFQLHYNGQPIDVMAVFMDRLVSHKSYFWGSKVFYIFLVGVYLVGVLLLIQTKPD